MTGTPAPTEIKREANNTLRISWSDGETFVITHESLRRACPCATCREAAGDESHSRPINTSLKPKSSLLRIVEHNKEEQLTLRRIWPVGNYAIGLEWGDGHGSGIFSYPLLREIGEAEAQTL